MLIMAVITKIFKVNSHIQIIVNLSIEEYPFIAQVYPFNKKENNTVIFLTINL
jgi:hypothetical protein